MLIIDDENVNILRQKISHNPVNQIVVPVQKTRGRCPARLLFHSTPKLYQKLYLRTDITFVLAFSDSTDNDSVAPRFGLACSLL